jgi:hypothetical protein
VLIREAAAAAKRADGTERSLIEAREHIADLARTIGMAKNQIHSLIAWLGWGTAGADPAASKQAEIVSRVARQGAERYEKMMPEKPGQVLGLGGKIGSSAAGAAFGARGSAVAASVGVEVRMGTISKRTDGKCGPASVMHVMRRGRPSRAVTAAP